MLPITIPASFLQAAFGPLSKIISYRPTLPILGYLRFERIDNRLAITATDLSAHLTFTCLLEPDPITPLGRTMAMIRWKRDAGIVMAPRSVLQAALRTKTESITIAEGEISYQLSGAVVRVPFATMDAAQFPEVPHAVVTSWASFDVAHRGWLQEAVQFASTDDTRYVLNGVYLEAGEDGRFVATDGRRLYFRPAPALANLSSSAILPTGVINILGTPALLAHDWFLGIGQVQTGEEDDVQYVDYGVVLAGPWRLVTKLIEGNYPNYRQIIPDERSQPPLSTWATLTIGPTGHRTLSSLLAQLPPPDPGLRAVRLHCFPDHLEVVCDSPNSQFVVPQITCDAPLAIFFDRRLLLDCLSLGPGIMRIVDEHTPGLYESGTARHVLMPMRYENATPMPDAELEAALAPWIGKVVKHDGSTRTVIGGQRLGLCIYARVQSRIKGGVPQTVPFSKLVLMAPPTPAPTPKKKPKVSALAAA